uniref:Uncharacterized protein n=1 Tax=viral metagenome TaxID=1070528 RepID=A0A6C0CYG5_9ZZZZ
MTTVNNYIIILDDEDEKKESKMIDILNISAVLIGLLLGYFGMNYEKLGPGNFHKSENFEQMIIFVSFIIVGSVSFYYYYFE